jgi:hypothetical protein
LRTERNDDTTNGDNMQTDTITYNAIRPFATAGVQHRGPPFWHHGDGKSAESKGHFGGGVHSALGHHFLMVLTGHMVDTFA